MTVSQQDKDARFWDKIAEKYAARPVDDEAVYQKKLTITRDYFTPDMKVLEVGCGTGSTALAHAPHVSHILATDISDNMLSFARDKAVSAGVSNVSFERAGIEDIAARGEAFDMVLALNVIHLMQDPAGALKGIYPLVKPGGYFVQSTVCMNDEMKLARFVLPVMQALGKAPHLSFFSATDLASWMDAAGFTVVRQWKGKPRSAEFIVAQRPS